jgi:Mn2+/Fe2+ NRAMP family transporter
MGDWRNSRVQNVLAWSLTVLIAAVAVLLLVSSFLPGVSAPLG